MPSHYRHGIQLGLERHGNEFYLAFSAYGTLSHQDYQYFTPIIEAALAKLEQPKINVFFDCSNFAGWELRAAWDDFKLGLKHGKAFNKIAIYSDQKNNSQWLELGAKIASWFISGNVEFFDSEDKAQKWLQGSH